MIAARRAHRALGAGLALWLVGAPGLRAEEGLDDILGGFDTAPLPAAEPVEPDAERAWSEAPWRLSGEARVGASVSYAQDAPNGSEADYRGLSRLQAGLRLVLDAEWRGVEARVTGTGFRDLVYPIKKREEFNHATLQAYEADLELGDTWLRLTPLPSLDVKVGRQVVAWGQSETLRVVDVLNPSDEREPGLADLADLRLPVAMTRMDYYAGPLVLTGIAIHEARPSKLPTVGSEFAPVGLPALGIDRPANGGDDTEWAAALGGRFQGFDASLHWARVYEDRPTLSPSTGRLAYARTTLLGASGSYVFGDWLLKGEVAQRRGLRFVAVPRRRFARSEGLVGVEYSGLRNTSVVVDVAARRLHGFESPLRNAPDRALRTSLETAIRCSRTFRNEALRVTLLAVLFGPFGREGAAYRLSGRYELSQGLIGEAGLLVYEGGHSDLLEAIDDRDRLFVSLRFSF